MNKFTKNLEATNKEIKGKRAQMIAIEVQEEQTDLLTKLKREKRALDKKLMDLEDLSPDSAYSLRPTAKDFNAKNWVKEIQDTKVSLRLIEVQIEIAEDTFKEYFSEVK